MRNHDFDFESFKKSGEDFHRDLVLRLRHLRIPAEDMASDHLCFRVATLGEYEFYKKNLAAHGELLIEAPVNGRPISTFKLHQAFRTEDHLVRLVELPAPKPGVPAPTGFEHAEFIVGESFDRLSARCPDVEWTRSGRQVLNPELCLKLGDRQAKFHHQSLERVIEIEKSEVKDIVFDFDGTLVRSRETIHEINRIVFSEALGREISLSESIEKFSPEFSRLFDAFALTCPLKRRRALSEWGRVADRFSYALFEGAVDLLRELRACGFRLHLWTARDEGSARKILRDHRIEDSFTSLSFATDFESKPHANSLRFDWAAAQADQVLMIGDTSTDILGSKNIRAIAGAALWDAHVDAGSLIAAGAELFFHELSDVGEWLASL